jgi:hypothetical protein
MKIKFKKRSKKNKNINRNLYSTHILDKIMPDIDLLNDWERSFVFSVNNQLSANKNLSARQCHFITVIRRKIKELKAYKKTKYDAKNFFII